MHNNKLLFIIIGDDNQIISENVEYLNNLVLPKEIEAEYCIISQKDNISNALETGRIQSDAHYKVYLDQNVYIIDKDLVLKFIKLFDSDSQITMAGVRGYYYDGKSGNMIGCNRYMRYANGCRLQELKEGEMSGIIDVAAIDESFVMTVDDTEWTGSNKKEQVIKKCIELKSKGHRTIVWKGDTPSVLFDNGIFDEE